MKRRTGQSTRRWRLCGNATYRFIEMEGMPRAVQTLSTADKLKGDRSTDVRVVRCSACGLVQLTDTLPKKCYVGDHLFFVSFSEHEGAHQEHLAERWVSDHGLSGHRRTGPWGEIPCGR
jgi:hypothetical protein